MVSTEFVFIGGLFGTVALLVYSLSGVLFRGPSELEQRLRKHDPDAPPQPGRSGRDVLGPVVSRIGEAAARPFMPKKEETQSALRMQLTHAGVYSTSAMQLVVGLKVILLAVGGIAGYFAGAAVGGIALWVFPYGLAVFGYMAPTLWLRHMVRSRKASLERSLPDALDLMVVCVEAGLTIDAAIQRVGHEIALAHPEISKEFGITHMETRIGVARVDALRNLGQRTGSPALQSLAAMLVQTEKFGTSIAQALRVHGDSLRTKRQHMAEEQAAKTTVKLAFPVVLFIFPCLIVVLGGPAFILFFKSPIFNR